MAIVRDSKQNVYEVPDELLEKLAESQIVVFDDQGREFGLPIKDLKDYQISEEEASQHKEFVLVKVLTGPKVHIQAPRRSSRCCNTGDVVTWCNGWA